MPSSASLQHAGLADAVTGQIGQKVGLGVAGQRHDGGTLVADGAGALEEPRRRPRQHVVRRALDQGAAQVLVAVVDVDIPCSRRVRRARDRARDLGMLDTREHIDQLAGLHVRADADRELGVPSRTRCRV